MSASAVTMQLEWIDCSPIRISSDEYERITLTFDPLSSVNFMAVWKLANQEAQTLRASIVSDEYNGSCTTSFSSYPISTYRRRRPSANCLTALLCLGSSTSRVSDPDRQRPVDGGRGWRDGSVQ